MKLLRISALTIASWLLFRNSFVPDPQYWQAAVCVPLVWFGLPLLKSTPL